MLRVPPSSDARPDDEQVTVARLWRYPVKSMGGEEVDALHLEPTGVVGDRLWALHDVERGATVSARRLPAALRLRARWTVPPAPGTDRSDPPAVVVTLPDGTETSSDEPDVDAVLSAALDREVSLVRLPRDRSGFRLPAHERLAMSDPAQLARDFGLDDDERLPDFSRMRVGSLLQLTRYGTPPGSFVDLSPVHVLTEASLRAVGAAVADGDGSPLPAERFRPNVLLAHPGDGLPEADWTGGTVSLGEARLAVAVPTVRCVVPSREHGPDLPRDRRVTRAVAEAGGRYLGVYADVARAGAVRVGDAVDVETPEDAGLLKRSVDRAWAGAVRGAVAVADGLRRRPGSRR